jgi:hypothetical protein
MTNTSKFKLPHYQIKLRESGAIGTINSPTKIVNRKLCGEIVNITDLGNVTGLEIKLNDDKTTLISVEMNKLLFEVGEQMFFQQRIRNYKNGSYDVTEKKFDRFFDLDETTYNTYSK